jgi:hypothetical protein
MFGNLFSSCRSQEFHIPPQFDAVLPFSQGIAAVQLQGQWGLVDTAGTWVLPPQFIAAHWTDGQAWQVQDAQGQTLEIRRQGAGWAALPPAPAELRVNTSAGVIFIFEQRGKYGLRDAQGRGRVPAAYAAIRYLGEDVFAARQGYQGECLLHVDGHILSDFYQEIGEKVQYGRIRIRQNDQYGLMDTRGKVLLPPCQWRLEMAGRHIACTEGGFLQLRSDRLEKRADWLFDQVLYLDAQHWLAKNTQLGQGVLFNADGEVVKSDIVLSDGQMVLGRFPVGNTMRDRWGYMDASGNAVLPCQWEYVENFWPCGKALFYDRDARGNRKAGLIDTSGQEVLPARYDAILWHPDGIFTVVAANRFQFLDKQLQALTPELNKRSEYVGHGVYLQYDLNSSWEIKRGNWYTGEKAGIYRRREAGVSGVFTLDGTLLVAGNAWLETEAMPAVKDGLAPAKKREKWGFVRVPKTQEH